jgi:hypothetical protein
MATSPALIAAARKLRRGLGLLGRAMDHVINAIQLCQRSQIFWQMDVA